MLLLNSTRRVVDVADDVDVDVDVDAVLGVVDIADVVDYVDVVNDAAARKTSQDCRHPLAAKTLSSIMLQLLISIFWFTLK